MLIFAGWKSFRTLQIQEPGAPKELQDRLRPVEIFGVQVLEIGFFWCLDFGFGDFQAMSDTAIISPPATLAAHTIIGFRRFGSSLFAFGVSRFVRAGWLGWIQYVFLFLVIGLIGVKGAERSSKGR